LLIILLAVARPLARRCSPSCLLLLVPLLVVACPLAVVVPRPLALRSSSSDSLSCSLLLVLLLTIARPLARCCSSKEKKKQATIKQKLHQYSQNQKHSGHPHYQLTSKKAPSRTQTSPMTATEAAHFRCYCWELARLWMTTTVLWAATAINIITNSNKRLTFVAVAAAKEAAAITSISSLMYCIDDEKIIR
jgi:hypothetical protein